MFKVGDVVECVDFGGCSGDYLLDSANHNRQNNKFIVISLANWSYNNLIGVKNIATDKKCFGQVYESRFKKVEEAPSKTAEKNARKAEYLKIGYKLVSFQEMKKAAAKLQWCNYVGNPVPHSVSTPTGGIIHAAEVSVDIDTLDYLIKVETQNSKKPTKSRKKAVADKKVFYKVVQVYSGTLYSGGVWNNRINYRLEEWIHAPQGTRLFVFEDLQKARDFASKDSYRKVYECEIKGSVILYPSTYHRHIDNYWKIVGKKIKNRHSNWKNIDEFSAIFKGTEIEIMDLKSVGAKSVKLIKQV